MNKLQMTTKHTSVKQLQKEIEFLKAKLEEATEVIDAIKNGLVDAVVVSKQKSQVYTLKGADYTYRAMVESMQEGAATVSLEGTILYSNARFAELVNIKHSVVTGSSVEDIVETDYKKTLKSLIKKAQNKGTARGELKLTAANGDGAYVECSLISLVNYDVPAMAFILNDLTARKESEALSKHNAILQVQLTERKKSQEARQRAKDLEAITAALTTQHAQLLELNTAKDEFIALASHQLRTPATGVKQYIGMLLEGYMGRLSKKQANALLTAYESNERQLNIINDLLRVAQVDAGKVILMKTQIDIVPLIQEVLDEQSAKFIQRNQTINFTHTQKNMIASFDKDRLRMVIENIIDNASKYTPNDKILGVSLNFENGMVVIAVTDTGVGIASQDLESIFRKFSRSANSMSAIAGGTGLGLYWAHKIVKLHGGDITIVSKPGKGSVFTIKIPKE